MDTVDGDPKQAFQLYLRYKALTDLYFLGNDIFGWKHSTDKTGKRRRVDPIFHRWMANILSLEDDKLLLVPRGHLKTTWAKARIVQRVLQNPNTRIGLFSVTSRKVMKELRDIKRLFTNQTLMSLFPDIIPDPEKDFRGWQKSTAEELTLCRDPDLSEPPEESQITALGSGARIAGMHIDELFPDDIIDKDSVNTAELMEKTEDWWAFMNAVLEVTGLTTMLGTFYHTRDLYNLIIREKQFKHNRIFIRPCMKDGEILYKSWFRHADFEKLKKRLGNYIFSTQYMLNPIPAEDQIFPPPQPTFSALPGDATKFYVTVDPAATTEKYSDQTAIVIAAVNEKKWIYIVEALPLKKPPNEIADILIKKCVQYRPERVGIELGLQTALQYIIEAKRDVYEAATGTTIPALHNIYPIPISRKMSKGDRINLTLGAFVREGRIWVKDTCRELLRQMESFTGKGKEQDDLVDAASMLFAVIEGFATNHWLEPQHYYGGMTVGDFCKFSQTKSWRDNFAN